MPSSVEATRKWVLALLVAGCVLVAGLYAVGSGVLVPAGSPSTTGPPVASPTPGNTTPPAPTPAPEKPGALRLALALTTDRPTYKIGDTVHVTITVTNLGNRTVTLGLPNPCSVVFLVFDTQGEIVFNSTAYFGCVELWLDVTLAPGASEVVSAYRWTLVRNNDTPVPAPATYRLVPMFFWGKLYQDSVVRTETATISVNA